MPTDPLSPSRLRFKKPPLAVASTSPKRRIELGAKPSASSLPYAKPVNRTQSAAEKMMRGVLTGGTGVKAQDSLYEKLKAEAGKKDGGNAKSALAATGRMAGNVARDLSSALGAIARGAAGLLKRKETKKAPKKSVPAKKRGVISELLRMGLVAGGTFGVAMLAMNWTAYASIVNFYYDKTTGTQVEQQQRLEQLVQEPDVKQEDAEPEKLAVDPNAAAPTLPKAGLERPPLTLDVAPPDNRIVIPKIGKNVPIVEVADKNLIKQDWKALEHDIQEGLLEGVVHYPGTATPGSKGNFFITGHSSFYSWTKSKYKDVFALLPEIGVGDRVTVYYDQKKYTYEIISETTVSPTDTSPLKATADNRITIMTCVPVGTDLNRLILVGKLVEE